MDITIKNPCTFPVEFYSLDFDRQYLEEEDILRSLTQGYDQFKNLLLPPRCPGDTLPEELLPKKPETPNDENNNDTITQNRTNSLINTDDQKGTEGNEINVEINDKDKTADDDPVQMAIARHLGVDLSPKGRAARKRLGLSVIVTGPPKSGKSELARQVVKHYGAALINIDEVIQEAILNSETKGGAAQKAYELCKEETNRKMSEMNALESSDGQVHGGSDGKESFQINVDKMALAQQL